MGRGGGEGLRPQWQTSRWEYLAWCPHLSWRTETTVACHPHSPTILLSVVLVGVEEGSEVSQALGFGHHTSANSWPVPRALTCLLQK